MNCLLSIVNSILNKIFWNHRLILFWCILWCQLICTHNVTASSSVSLLSSIINDGDLFLKHEKTIEISFIFNEYRFKRLITFLQASFMNKIKFEQVKWKKTNYLSKFSRKSKFFVEIFWSNQMIFLIDFLKTNSLFKYFQKHVALRLSQKKKLLFQFFHRIEWNFFKFFLANQIIYVNWY